MDWTYYREGKRSEEGDALQSERRGEYPPLSVAFCFGYGGIQE